MGIEIKEVTDLKDLKTFIMFPFSLYKGNPYWVPPLIEDEFNSLRQDENPAFEYSQTRYWLAYKDGKLAGRIAAILNRRHLERWGQNYMRFGWVDFIDDLQVSRALFQCVEAWAVEMGTTAVHGPLGFSDMDKSGMLIEGFDELPTMATYYNYPYYPVHLEQLGYVKDKDWMEYEIQVPAVPDENIARIANIALRRNKLKLLKVKSKKDLLPYAYKLFDLLQETYQNLYGFVPFTEKQVAGFIKQYFGYISPEFVPVVLDENDNMVAFGITMPSLSKALQKARGRLFPFGFIHILRALKKNDRGDLYLVGVKPEYQGKGVNAILMHEMNQVFIKLGVTKVETNPELEDNANVQGQWKYFEKRMHKRRRCYIKQVGQ